MMPEVTGKEGANERYHYSGSSQATQYRGQRLPAPEESSRVGRQDHPLLYGLWHRHGKCRRSVILVSTVLGKTEAKQITKQVNVVAVVTSLCFALEL